MVQEIANFCDREHEQINQLFEEYLFMKSKDIERTKKYFKKFKCALHRHMNLEEDALFVPFEAKIGLKNIGPTVAMRHEHDIIRGLLKNILDKLNEGNLATEIYEEQLKVTFEKHGSNEDKVLLPSLEALMQENEIEDMIQNMNSYALGCCRACHKK